MGLAREDLILGAERFTNSDGSDVNIQVDANKPEEQRFELNPDHTHYIIVRDDTVHKTGINQYTLRFERSAFKCFYYIFFIAVRILSGGGK